MFLGDLLHDLATSRRQAEWSLVLHIVLLSSLLIADVFAHLQSLGTSHKARDV